LLSSFENKEVPQVISISDRFKDFLNMAGALLWAFLIIASWAGGGNPRMVIYGLIACAAVIVVYYLQGAVTNGKMSVKILIYPVLLNALFWVIAFSMIYYTRGQNLDLVCGMHPGFLSAMIFFWLGSFVTATLSFYLFFRSDYLPDETWDRFIASVRTMEKIR